MGSTRYMMEIPFYEGDDRPEDRRAREDFQGAVAALLADPVYEDLACPAEDATAAVRELDWESRVRVIQLLQGALTRVRTVTPEQAASIPDDLLVDLRDRPVTSEEIDSNYAKDLVEDYQHTHTFDRLHGFCRCGERES